jgi:hypothetical protein
MMICQSQHLHLQLGKLGVGQHKTPQVRCCSLVSYARFNMYDTMYRSMICCYNVDGAREPSTVPAAAVGTLQLTFADGACRVREQGPRGNPKWLYLRCQWLYMP